MFRGDPSRSGLGVGWVPLLERKWTASTIQEEQTKQWLDDAVRQKEASQ
jgi:hypothetical protein